MYGHLKIAKKLTILLDEVVKIGPFRVGLDPLLGLLPGIGDIASLVLSGYIIWIGIQLRLPAHKIALMAHNILLDFLIGIIPIIGDITDFVYKANSKNMRILEEHVGAVVEGEYTPSR